MKNKVHSLFNTCLKNASCLFIDARSQMACNKGFTVPQGRIGTDPFLTSLFKHAQSIPKEFIENLKCLFIFLPLVKLDKAGVN